MKCLLCNADPSSEPTASLRRINAKGIKGEWMCTDCINEVERLDGKFHYVHSFDCAGYCDYACNGQSGFDMAEQIQKHLP
jgi:hypothetical protein